MNIKELKKHPYFTNEHPIFDWEKLRKKEYESPLKKYINIDNDEFY